MGRCSQGCRNFGLAVCNPKEGKFCGRTFKSWALILIYYCVYYSCLAAFWFGMLSAILYGLTNEKIPSLTGMQSLLKLNPGIGFLPEVDTESTLYQVPVFDNTHKTAYLDYMEKYLKGYPFISSNCDFEKDEAIGKSVQEPCEFPLDLLGPCKDPRNYIEQNKNVCIYMKMNKIYGFLPDIKEKKILVSCGPANAFDRENLNEPEYYPSITTPNGTFGYFSSVVFPYLNQPNYQAPLVAVTFPNIRKNAVVMVSCSLVNVGDHEGFRFDLSVDTDKSVAFQ